VFVAYKTSNLISFYLRLWKTVPAEVLVRLRFFALHSLTENFVPKIGWQVLEIISTLLIMTLTCLICNTLKLAKAQLLLTSRKTFLTKQFWCRSVHCRFSV